MATTVSLESTTRSLFDHTQKRYRSVPKATILGFTLIEVMVSVCIIGVLSAIATPLYVGYRERARVAVAISDMKSIEAAIFNFVANNSALPDTLAQVGLGNFRDPWGNPYAYLRIDGGDGKGKGKLRKDHFMVPVNTDFPFLYRLLHRS